jgi:hypothetical protein
MDDLRTRAQLVGFDPALAGTGAIGTVVTRAEIAETAALGEFPATLLLDLDRVGSEDGDEVMAHARVLVDLDKDTLEQLLASTEDEDIALWFDERELARAFDDPEVEAHGLREKVAVIAIAAAAAGASATPAMARFAADGQGGGGGGAAHPAAVMQVDQNIGLKQAQPATQRGPQVDQNIGLKQALPQGAQRAGQAMSVDQNIGLKTPETAGSGTMSVNPQAAHEQGATSMGAVRGLEQDEQLGVQQVADTSGGGSGGISPGEIGGIVGAGALLIAAAGFGATRKRVPPAQPA